MADLTPLLRQLDRRVDAVGRRFADNLERELHTKSPKVTGELDQSQTVTYKRTPNLVTWTAEATAKYAKFVARGTRPHVIRPRVKKALRFTKGGAIIFATKVNHPGTRANRWWDDTLTDYRQALSRAWRETEHIR